MYVFISRAHFRHEATALAKSILYPQFFPPTQPPLFTPPHQQHVIFASGRSGTRFRSRITLRMPSSVYQLERLDTATYPDYCLHFTSLLLVYTRFSLRV